MTTLATVRSAWSDNVWANATVRAFTEQIHDFDPTQSLPIEDAQVQIHNTHYQTRVNCIIYLTSRTSEYLLSNQVRHLFPVLIRYYLEKDAKEDNYNTLLDRFEAIDGVVLSGLGVTWNSTVDYSSPQEGAVSVTTQVIDSRPCWVGEYTYTGTITENLV
jgi:hypothetical protein